jgi:hypothetical protein
MKQANFVLTISLVLHCGSASGQSGVAPDLPSNVMSLTPSPADGSMMFKRAPDSFSPGQQHRYYTVKAYMGFPSPLRLGDQLLAGMGDEAAADVLLILSTRSPLSASEMQTAMDIVHKSFLRPRAIQSVADRKPTASLALLQKFQATAVDQLVKERIAAEKNFLDAVPQTFPPLTLPADLGTPSSRNPLGLTPR